MNENVTRSLSGLVYILVLVFATLFSRESFLVLFGLFMLQTVREFCNLIFLPKTPALLVAGLLYFIFGCFLPENKLTDFGLIAASLFVSIRLLFWLFKEKKSAIDVQGKWVNLIGYIILPFIFIAKISNLEGTFQPKLIIAIFILIWTNDTFAYIVGKSIGKNKLFESISPKKTIEGFVGGVVFAIIASIIISKYYLQMPVYVWIITALIISFFGTIGDLVESKFKRIANVKDSGNIMPGHGGMLDRLDSIIFVAPFLFLFYKIIVYVS
ncbi:phosphatidate cytidylyltransferase [Flavobacterium swingsii]|jgi:phosphatidate cytidylyltransferase|uniref:Phosphatidate cytidylyltransferase n=1 Tax=Flavobacterium swingsii TaxID=498292 RepID=A0A1I0WA73_9FLAO|nr:phosphatidate cytidylyltransferase [Flavobacterium swingsii]SFA85619.1 phosphatidate cytidylyltransferase [Flavobacterium swingsii]